MPCSLAFCVMSDVDIAIYESTGGAPVHAIPVPLPNILTLVVEVKRAEAMSHAVGERTVVNVSIVPSHDPSAVSLSKLVERTRVNRRTVAVADLNGGVSGWAYERVGWQIEVFVIMG